VERKDDRLISGEEAVEIPVGQAVRMLALRLECHKIYDVHNAHLQFWKSLPQAQLNGVIEVMTHPGYIDGLDRQHTRLYEHRQIELTALCSQSVKKLLCDSGFELIHYGKI